MPVPRRLLLRFALLLLPLLAGPVLAQAPAPRTAGYVPGIEDVPLMAGLAPVGGADTNFDSPQGRIVIAHAAGALDRAAVLAFYAQSLTALGWDRIGDAAFRREGELLRLETLPGAGAGSLTVRFTLSPVR